METAEAPNYSFQFSDFQIEAERGGKWHIQRCSLSFFIRVVRSFKIEYHIHFTFASDTQFSSLIVTAYGSVYFIF